MYKIYYKIKTTHAITTTPAVTITPTSIAPNDNQYNYIINISWFSKKMDYNLYHFECGGTDDYVTVNSYLAFTTECTNLSVCEFA